MRIQNSIAQSTFTIQNSDANRETPSKRQIKNSLAQKDYSRGSETNSTIMSRDSETIAHSIDFTIRSRSFPKIAHLQIKFKR